MECAVIGKDLVLAGLVPGLILGFLFRVSDAESRYARAYPYRHNGCLGFTGLLVCVVGVVFLVLWAPTHLFHFRRLCDADTSRTWKFCLLVGVLLGWFLRYLAFRYWQRHGAWPRGR